MTTFTANAQNREQNWYIVDADGLTLGRLAAALAHRLRGKHKPEFTPHCDTGDFFVVLNAQKIHVTGNKGKDKLYYRHSGRVGSLKTTNFDKMQSEHPTRALKLAVKGMLPRGPLGREMLTKLKIFAGAEHDHSAQQPQPIEF